MNQAIDELNKGNTKIGDELAWKVNEILFPTFKGNLTGPQPSSPEEQNLINKSILANRKARAIRDLSHLEKAQKIMNEECEKNPFYRSHYVYLYEKGRILARLKRYDETISCFKASKKY